MSLSINRHRYPASTPKAPNNDRANTMAEAIEPHFRTLLANVASADAAEDILLANRNPRLEVTRPSDNLFKVWLKCSPANLCLLTIHVR